MIRVGIGGWTYEPWRGAFYPAGLTHAGELTYSSRHLTTLEINGTFYRTQSAESFRKWRDETPDSFVFSVKGHRAVVNRRILAEAGEPIEWFFKSGVLELGEKLGPILWQFAPFKKFDAKDFGSFLALLPREAGGRPVRQVVEVPVACRCHCGLRLCAATAHRERNRHRIRARRWESGGISEDLPRVGDEAALKTKRPVFVYMIGGAKVRAPAATMALIERNNR
jgi:uncharacterized protein YecE (DUF72 family)